MKNGPRGLIYDQAAQLKTTADLTGLTTSSLFVGTAGNVKVDLAGGSTGVVFKATAGAVLPLDITKIYSTANGTTATDLVELK